MYPTPLELWCCADSSPFHVPMKTHMHYVRKLYELDGQVLDKATYVCIRVGRWVPMGSLLMVAIS